MFIGNIFTNPHFFVYVLVTMVFSIVMHELAHGWAAIWQGDRTPIDLGHMTIDPRVHMGAASLVMLAVAGIGFGAMPVDPSRFRSRYGDALVSIAGPLMNLLLGFVALTALASWQVATSDPDAISMETSNLHDFLWVLGYCNLGLFAFNLIPIPPLDGSTVLANFHQGYARMIRSVRDPKVFLVPLIVLFTLISMEGYGVYDLSAHVASLYMQLVYSLMR